ncbi:MAG: ABC transporter ATP-binding protein [Cytophagales bacterium]|nr:ABC transporter ATP-binding protein [Cytophagales bacterium]
MLHISNFKKSYNQHIVLEIPELEFPQGILWIKGVNGSGKTTLFRCISGLIPFDGHIVLNNGLDLKNHPIEYRKLVNYGEAEPQYPGYLSGMDLISFVGKAKGAEVKQIDYLLDSLDVRSYVKQPVGTYSSGMQKKVSLIMAFLGQPKLIILDEPLTTVDAKASETIFKLIMEYNQKHGADFLISSHQLFEETDIPVSGQYLVHNQTIQRLS